MAREPADVTALRRALGEKLAAHRRSRSMTQRELGARTFSDRTRIAHLERGTANANDKFWEAADAACNANGDLLATYHAVLALKLKHQEAERAVHVAAALAEVNRLRPDMPATPPEPPFDRFGDEGHGVDLGESPNEYLARTRIELTVPSEVGWADVRKVQLTTEAIALSENMFGGGARCEPALTELRWARRHLDSRASKEVRRAMYEAVGNLGSVVAYSAFDIASYNVADRCFAFTLWCAEKADSWGLRSNTLAETARKAEYLGDYDKALTSIEFAQVRKDRLSAAARAMLWMLQARILALTGRHAEAVDDIKRADEEFAEASPSRTPPWLRYYDAAEHQGSTGKALIPVARARNDLEIAASRLARAVIDHREEYPRSRAFSRTRLATLTMEIGDPREAAAIGRQAYTEARSLQSTRITKELKVLAVTSSRHTDISDATDLAHDISRLPELGVESSRM